jgi:hypothetical protein
MISGMTILIDHYVTDGASMVRFQNGLTDLKGNGKESDNTKFLHSCIMPLLYTVCIEIITHIIQKHFLLLFQIIINGYCRYLNQDKENCQVSRY